MVDWTILVRGRTKPEVDMKNNGNHCDNEKDPKLTNTKESKRPYRKPQLEVYGDLREITQTFATKGAKDGGVAPPDRTHV